MHISDDIFDELLTAALYRAVELDCADLPSDEELDRLVQPSSRFTRRMNELLRNPNRYLRNHRRPVYIKALRIAASLAVTFTILIGAAIAVSPTVRAAVFGFVRTWFSDRTVYQPVELASHRGWTFSYIPSGFELTEDIETDLKSLFVYQNSGGMMITINILNGKQAIDNEHSAFSYRIINGRTVDIYESNDEKYPNVIAVYDEETGDFITIYSEIEIGELIKIAENIK